MERFLLVVRYLAIASCVVILAAACQDDDEVARQIEGDVIGSPTTAAGLEEDIEEASIEISDGAFVQDRLELVQDRPTVLRVTNNDNTAYVLRINPLLNESTVAAGNTVTIEFTTPVENTYTAELLPEGGGEPLATMPVAVINAAGVSN